MHRVDLAVAWLTGMTHADRSASRRYLAPDVSPRVAVGLRRAAILGCALGGIFIDQTVSGIGTATLAAQQGDFALGPEEAAWIPTLFNAAYYAGIFASIWGMIRFGRRAYVGASLIGFAVTSLAGCVASPWLFLAIHALQGMFLGGVYTTAATIIFVSHEPRELGRAFLGFSITSLSGATAGPLIGGAFVEFGCWQDAYVWFALASAVAACAGLLALPSNENTQPVEFDTTAFALALLAGTAFGFLVNDGDRRDWFSDDAVVVAALTWFGAFIGLGVWTLRYSRRPLFTAAILTHRNLVIGAVLLTVLAVAQSANNHFVAFAQAGVAFTPSLAGTLLAIRIPVFVFLIPAVGLNVLAGRLAIPHVLTCGFLLLGAATWLLAGRMSATDDFAALATFMLLIGTAQSVINQPLPPLIFGAIPRGDAPMAAVVFKLTPLVAGAAASAASQRLLTVSSAQYRSDVAGALSVSAPTVARFAASIGVRRIEQLVDTQITALAYAHVVEVLALTALLALPAIGLIRRQAPARGQPTADRQSAA